MKITPLHASCLNFKLKTSVLGGLLLCAALSSSALTVGRMRGAAWLGQPLDVTIQVQYDETESLAALCFDAEVFHADTRQEAGRVRVSVESGAQAYTAQVRVQSAVAVDEPVVSVYLREGCVSKTARRYVLLAEIPGEVVPSAALATAAPAPRGQAFASGASQGAAPAAPAPRATASVAPARPAPARPVVPPAKAPVAEARSKTAETTVPRKQELAVAIKPKSAPESAGKSQLKLDPLSSLNERVAQLEDVTLAAHTADGDREAQRLKKMEESVATLLALAAKNDRGMAELRERLQQAEAEKYDNPLVYGLAALLLSALGAAAYFWRRQQRVRTEADWWRGEPENGASVPAAPPAPRPPAPPQQPSPVPLAAVAATAAAVTASRPLVGEAGEPPALQQERGAATDIDLDDLMAPMVSENLGGGSAPEVLAQSFPALMPAIPKDAVATGAAPEAVLPEVESTAAYEFPAAGEVHIDVSHLSLSPVAPPPAAPAEALLDFDFPDFEPEEVPGSGATPKKTPPGSSA